MTKVPDCCIFVSFNAAIIQKRLKKEKKAKRKLQEALEYESKRREQAEQSLKQTSPTESLRSLNGETPYQKVNILKFIKVICEMCFSVPLLSLMRCVKDYTIEDHFM